MNTREHEITSFRPDEASVHYFNKYRANPAIAIWATVIRTDAVCSNTNLRLCLLSEAEFIAGIKNSPVGIVETDMKKINKNASKFVTTKIGEATKATMNT